MKKSLHPALVVTLLAALVLALAGVIFTSGPAASEPSRSTAKTPANSPAAMVDEQPLKTAQRLAPLAISSDEQEYSQAALHVADHEVDLAFAYALHSASDHPPVLSPESHELAARLTELQLRAKTEETDLERLKQLVAKADVARKESLQQQLALAQAKFELSQDEIDDARQDLMRAGGDPQGALQRLLADHEASLQHKDAATPGVPARPLKDYEDTESRSVVAKFLAWRELNYKQTQLGRALEELTPRVADLAGTHGRLEAQARSAQSGKMAPGVQAAAAAPADNSSVAAATALSGLQRRKEMQLSLASLDKRIQDLQQLAGIYTNWRAFVLARQRTYVNGLFWSAAWILLILLLTFLAEPLLHHFYSRLAPEYKRLHTLRTVVRFAARTLGILLILLVVFGPPGQLGTIIAFTGAGLTLALKDFIVGFFGWFVLMGRNGIHPGDWVEINGVAGEVLEVGLLHTVLLETGSWADADHPTGRKVTFVNSFAIEHHYFNFSTSGQWFWDELHVQVPASANAYELADLIQKMAASETQENAQLAEQEWRRAVPDSSQRPFTAQPVMFIRPGMVGIDVIVRYLTRAKDRHEIRTRMYRQIVEILHGKQVPQDVS